LEQRFHGLPVYLHKLFRKDDAAVAARTCGAEHLPAAAELLYRVVHRQEPIVGFGQNGHEMGRAVSRELLLVPMVASIGEHPRHLLSSVRLRTPGKAVALQG